MSDASRPDTALTSMLAFVAGFVDTCGFVALYGLFSAHVTGNFVLLGASLVLPHAGVVAKLLALPVFMCAVAATRWRLIRAGGTGLRGVLAAEAVFLLLFLAAGVTATPIRDADAPAAVTAAMLAIVAMGIQNAASRTVLASLSPTTVMTGNVTQIVLDLVDVAAAATQDARSAARARVAKFGPPVIAFALGAAGGALGFGWSGFWCLAVPVAALVVLWVRSARA